MTDFGLSKDEVETDKGATTFCGTPEYLGKTIMLGMVWCDVVIYDAVTNAWHLL